MCFKIKTPKLPNSTAHAPRREDVQSSVMDERRRLGSMRGVFENVFTSALGDTGYGQNAQKLAKLGAAS